MKTNTPIQPPDEDRLHDLLSAFMPEPSEQFHQRLAHAPWFSATDPSLRSKRNLSLKRWGWVSAACALIILFSLLFLTTPLQGMARRLMVYFMPEVSDTLQVNPPSAQSDYNALSYDEAQSLTGFPLKNITYLPPGYTFVDAQYDPITLAVSFRYLSGNAQIIFTQRPLHTVEEYFSVGASANIENVLVHESPGELVSGGWKVLQPVQKVDSTPTVEEAPLQTAWDPDLPQFTLRWQSGDMAYEIRSHSNPEINKEIILKIAESIK